MHPPLSFWLRALAGRLFGFTEFTARLWTALSGAAGVAVTYALGVRLFDRRAAAIAALVLATMLEWFALSRLVVFDAMLVTFALLALLMALVAEERIEGGAAEARGAYRWAFLWAGMATLTKGPVGLLFPGMVLVAWWALRGWLGGRGLALLWNRLRRLPWEGWLLYALVGLSWYVAETAAHGVPFLRVVAGYYMVTRFFGAVEGQGGPWYYYLPILIGGALPWTGFLPGALTYHARRARVDAHSLLLIGWIGVTSLFFSVAGTKLPNYILPIYPAVALAVGALWSRAAWSSQGEGHSLMAWGYGLAVATTVLTAAAVMVTLPRLVSAEATAVGRSLTATVERPLTLVAAIFFAGLGVAVSLFALRRAGASLIALIATAVAALVALVTVVLPAVEPLKPARPAAEFLRPLLRPGEPIVGIGLASWSLVYYSRARGVWTDTPQQVRQVLCRGARLVLTTRETYATRLRAAFGAALSPVWEQAGMLLVQRTRPISCLP